MGWFDRVREAGAAERIRENIANTALGMWHEAVLEVEVPHRDPYRATRRVAVELATTPHIRVGAKVPVRVDPQDGAKVLVVSDAL